MKSIPTPTLQKTIFQVRYKPELKFFELFRRAAQAFPVYPHWSTDSVSVTLCDFENLCSLAIRHDHFSFDHDADDPVVEEARITNALAVLPSELQIQAFNRLGFRRQYLISTDISFESLVPILYLKLFSQDERLICLLPRRVDDLLYRVDSADERNRFHVWVGPVRRHEIPRWVAFNAENHLAPEIRDEKYRRLLAAYPETSVFVDIDVYLPGDEIPISEAADFVSKARERTTKLAFEMTEYLFATEVK